MWQPISQPSPLRMVAYESLKFTPPPRSDLTSVPRSTSPASTVSRISYSCRARRLVEEIGACEHGRREPSDDGDAHLAPTSEYSRRVTQSVRALSHRCNASPLEANSWRIRAASQPTRSSRMGTRTLRALSLMTVLRAIRVMCLASDTAIVKPFPLLTCSITWTSELPSPT